MVKPFLFFLVVLLLSNTIIAQTIVDSGLVAYYPFNSNALDESGNGNDAIVFGATLAADRFDILNSAYFLNGIDNYIEAVNTTLPTASASRTVCFWLKSQQDSTATIINFGTIEAVDTNTIFDIYYKNGCVSSYTLLGGFGGWASNDNHWHHAAVVYEDTTFCILYQDGQQNVMEWGPGVKLNTIGTSMRIGTPLSSAQKRQFFSGIIDDIRIYNRALTEIEINSLYLENEWVDVYELNTNSPTDFSLSQNFPNPFNPSTIISFQLPVSENVNLKVYDLLGMELETLLNEEKIPGNYKVEFNAEKYSSGVYFYIMRAGNFIESKKLILLK